MAVNDINWRGPRPLAAGDILKGRDRDLNNLVNKARTFDVLEITAPSGFGKSSFIAAGLIPALRRDGAEVVPSRSDWAWSSVLADYDEVSEGAIQPEALYRLCLGWPTGGDGRSLRERFDDVGGMRQVVVLDQFEELIRYRERLGAALLTFVGEQAAKLGITHVIAGRSEYRDQLRPVEEACDSFFHWPLPEIDNEDALADIIQSPVQHAGLQIDGAVVATLSRWWSAARQDSTPGTTGALVGRGDVGLLHLQGVLWLFKGWLVAEDPELTLITQRHLDEFADAYVGAHDDEHGPRILQVGLVEYIREHCSRLHQVRTGPNEWSPAERAGRGAWSNGPRLMMARTAHLLSVLGYKVAQSRSGMFNTVLAEDLEAGGARAVALAAVGCSSPDWQADVAEALDGKVGAEGRGLGLGWTPEQVLDELLAAAQQAWTAAAGKEANILRRFAQEDDDVYELVHDGMGAALQEWANQELGESRAILGVITSRSGKSLAIDLEPATFLAGAADAVPHYWDGVVSVEHADGRRRVGIAGLGWDASAITSDLHDVTLIGWSLRGALFDGVTMRDVVFRNCDMKGAAFHDTTMEGVHFEHCNLSGAAVRRGTLSGVEFGRQAGDGGSLDLLSFEDVTASGEGVSFPGVPETLGLMLRRVKGGPWEIDGTVRHLGLHADGDATFVLGPGRYEHITVEPQGLAVSVDPQAVTTYSEIDATRNAST